MTTTTIPANAIFTHNSQVMTNTLKVAEAFRKNHKDILRKIDSLDCSKDFTERNFALSEYKDSTGRTLPLWEMTKDGFIFLVMGFTGKQAAQIKEAYIKAFNLMAEELQKNAPATFASIMGQTIGTDGFQCLAGVLEGKVRHLPLPDKKRVKNHIWSQVHKAFSVVSAQDIPADKLDSARNFIAAYQVLEGELLIGKKPDEHFIQDVESIEYVNAWLRVAAHRQEELKNLSVEFASLSEQISQITQRLNFVSRKLFDPIREPIMHMPRPKGYSVDRTKEMAGRLLRSQDRIG